MGGARSWRSRLEDRRRSRRALALSRAVTELPTVTRRAMLTAIDDEELIVGGYADQAGRICPMLAAHRRGARTDVGNFPRAWDAFGGARRPRPASKRELQILKALLEESFSGPALRSRSRVMASDAKATEPKPEAVAQCD